MTKWFRTKQGQNLGWTSADDGLFRPDPVPGLPTDVPLWAPAYDDTAPPPEPPAPLAPGEERITALWINKNAATTKLAFPANRGHATGAAQALVVAQILQENGIGDGRVSGSKNGTPPNGVKEAHTQEGQKLFHAHAGGKDSDQVFFGWSWSNGVLTIETKQHKHKPG